MDPGWFDPGWFVSMDPGWFYGPWFINSENRKKYKRYKQLVLKSSKCINCTEVKRHSANHVVLTLTPEVNIVGINKVFFKDFLGP